jgi:subtilase family serine protease
VTYAPPERDFSLSAADLVFDSTTGVISATVHNSGKTAGPVTVGFFDGPPEDNNLLTVLTIKRIEAGASETVGVALTGTVPGNIAVMADPYNVIPETDETNNRATLSTGDAKPTPGNR